MSGVPGDIRFGDLQNRIGLLPGDRGEVLQKLVNGVPFLKMIKQ